MCGFCQTLFMLRKLLNPQNDLLSFTLYSYFEDIIAVSECSRFGSKIDSIMYRIVFFSLASRLSFLKFQFLDMIPEKSAFYVASFIWPPRFGLKFEKLALDCLQMPFQEFNTCYAITSLETKKVMIKFFCIKKRGCCSFLKIWKI